MTRNLALAAALLALGLMGCASSGNTDADGANTGAVGGSEFDQGGLSGDGGGDGRALSDLQTVYFDYDRFEIRADARDALRNNAQAINANQGWGTVTVEGHCDERGSEEYNLALGERRASAVKRYLVDLGVPTGRLRTVSFGEAKPAVPGHNESAWRYNRRSEFRGG